MTKSEKRASSAETTLQQERTASQRLAQQLQQARSQRKVKEPVLVGGLPLLDGQGHAVYREVMESASNSSSSSLGERTAGESLSSHQVVMEDLQRQVQEERSKREDWEQVADLRKKSVTETQEKMKQLEQQLAPRRAYLDFSWDLQGVAPEGKRLRAGAGAIFGPARVGAELAPAAVFYANKHADGTPLSVAEAWEPRAKVGWDFK